MQISTIFSHGENFTKILLKNQMNFYDLYIVDMTVPEYKTLHVKQLRSN